MKHRTSKLFAALLACAASAGAMAQATPSFKITVSGTITPGSCKPESGDLTFDMKNINPKSLNNDKMTQLPMILQKVKITCTADTSIALSAQTTASAATAPTGNLEHTQAGTSTYPQSQYDLVDDNKNRAGVFAMQFRNFSYTGGGTGASTNKAVIIKSTDKNSWSTAASNGWDAWQLKTNGSDYLSFASPTADTTPVLASTFEGELIVAPAILPKKDLKLTGDLKISGGATITLNYL